MAQFWKEVVSCEVCLHTWTWICNANLIMTMHTVFIISLPLFWQWRSGLTFPSMLVIESKKLHTGLLKLSIYCMQYWHKMEKSWHHLQLRSRTLSEKRCFPKYPSHIPISHKNPYSCFVEKFTEPSNPIPLMTRTLTAWLKDAMMEQI